MADEKSNEKIEMLSEGLAYMDDVLNLINDVCANLRKKEGIEVIGQISEGLMAIIRIVKYTESVTGIKIDEENVLGFVSDMVDGMENGDFNLISDIIEYEIKPLYEDWSEAFSRVLNND